MNNLLTRFWFEFQIEDLGKLPGGIGYGCGVSGFDYDDAINILQEKVFKNIEIPKIVRFIENVNINELDQNHLSTLHVFYHGCDLYLLPQSVIFGAN